MLRLLGLLVNRSHYKAPGPQLGYVIYCQTLETIQPGFVAGFVEDKVFSPNASLFSSYILLFSSSCACSSFLCRSYSVLVRSSSRFFLVQHAVFLHAPSACVRVLAVQVLSAALFLFLSLCCRRRCNLFHGLNHHPKKMKGFLICHIKMNQVTIGVSCPRLEASSRVLKVPKKNPSDPSVDT